MTVRRMNPPKDQENWMGEHEAKCLAKSIEDFWAERGLACKTELVARERLVKEYTKIDYDIRSNIGPNGYPPRIALAFAA